MKIIEPENKRLEELETRIAFQDQTIEELNQVVITLREQVAELSARVKGLSIHASFDFASKDKDIEPPHY